MGKVGAKEGWPWTTGIEHRCIMHRVIMSWPAYFCQTRAQADIINQVVPNINLNRYCPGIVLIIVP